MNDDEQRALRILKDLGTPQRGSERLWVATNTDEVCIAVDGSFYETVRSLDSDDAAWLRRLWSDTP